MRSWSHRPVLTSSIGISGCTSVKSGGPTSIYGHNPQQREIYGLEWVKIPSVSKAQPAGYMLWSFRFPLLIWGIFHRFLQNEVTNNLSSESRSTTWWVEGGIWGLAVHVDDWLVGPINDRLTCQAQDDGGKAAPGRPSPTASFLVYRSRGGARQSFLLLFLPLPAGSLLVKKFVGASLLGYLFSPNLADTCHFSSKVDESHSLAIQVWDFLGG